MEVAESLTPWLLTGMGGVLGWGVALTPPPTTFVIAGRTRPELWPEVPGVRLDLSRAGEFAAVLEKLKPSVVVHAACISRAQECDDDPALARRVNVEAVVEWLATAAAWDSFPLYVSTEQVFDGCSSSYHEGSPISPRSLYGATKAEAESLVLEAGGAVVRLPLLLGPVVAPGRCGADSAILTAVLEGRRLSLFHDEIRTPVSAAAVGPMMWRIAERRLPGIFHLAGADAVSRWELGNQACALAGLEADFEAVSATAFEGPPRSLELVLDCERTRQALGWEPPNLRQSLSWTSSPCAPEDGGIRSQKS